jgi:hypothetical protein
MSDEKKEISLIEQEKRDNSFKFLENIKCETDKKLGLTYVSWAEAWSKFKEHFPNAGYQVHEFRVDEHGNSLPYFADATGGYVKVSVWLNLGGCGLNTIWMPILGNDKKAMKKENITSFNVNTSIQRALTKAIAMCGLGIYVYKGEDLPSEEKPAQSQAIAPKSKPAVEGKLVCENTQCNKEISPKVAKYSEDKFGIKFCMDCQKKYENGEFETGPTAEELEHS